METSERKGQNPTILEKIETTVRSAGDGLAAAYLAIGVVIGWLVGIAAFIGSWIYCISEYGYLLGVTLGWIPGVIVAPIAGVLAYVLWGLLPLIAIVSWAIWYS